MGKIILRKYRKKDAKQVCEIIKLNDLTVTYKDYPKRLMNIWIKGDTPEWIERISKKTLCFVLINRKRVVGYVSLKNKKISKMFIHPSYHGRGYGRKLLDKAIEAAKKKGTRTISLHSNLGAKGFYIKCGFKLIKKVRIYEGKVPYYCYLMKKKI